MHSVKHLKLKPKQAGLQASLKLTMTGKKKPLPTQAYQNNEFNSNFNNVYLK